MTRIGDLVQELVLENPGAPVPDGDGGFTEGWAALSPSPVWAAIKPATPYDLERVMAGTVQSTASHLITIRYHPDVTMKTRLTKGPRNPNGSLAPGSREFSITGKQNIDERNIELVLACAETLT